MTSLDSERSCNGNWLCGADCGPIGSGSSWHWLPFWAVAAAAASIGLLVFVMSISPECCNGELFRESLSVGFDTLAVVNSNLASSPSKDRSYGDIGGEGMFNCSKSLTCSVLCEIGVFDRSEAPKASFDAPNWCGWISDIVLWSIGLNGWIR